MSARFQAQGDLILGGREIVAARTANALGPALDFARGRCGGGKVNKGEFTAMRCLGGGRSGVMWSGRQTPGEGSGVC
jgi:hypothetical protein